MSKKQASWASIAIRNLAELLSRQTPRGPSGRTLVQVCLHLGDSSTTICASCVARSIFSPVLFLFRC